MPQHPKLTADLLVRKDALPETVKPPASSGGARMAVSYRPLETTYEQLRTISFIERRPIQALIDEAVLAWLERHPREG